MLVPSLGCPANCSYCFGPHKQGPVMSIEIVQAIVKWLRNNDSKSSLEITFHGGEPLIAGAEFYRTTLPLLRKGLAPKKIRFTIQSNLWLLNDELCEIFREHNVSIGTSLDGPKEITDEQRGPGYFRRTMEGIELAEKYGLPMGTICTFTAKSAQKYKEIFSFFRDRGLPFSIHAALPVLKSTTPNDWELSPDAYGNLLRQMLDLYLDNLKDIRIFSLDSICQSISAGKGGICSFTDCLGAYLAIGPDGFIYPCQRFCGMEEFRIGDIRTCPSMEELKKSPIWQRFYYRQRRVDEECASCAHQKYCRGGCTYNAFITNGSSSPRDSRDRYCASYKQIFEYITEKALAEVFSEENMTAVVDNPDDSHGLLRVGKILPLMRNGSHPAETASQAKRVIAAWLLGKFGDAEIAADEFIGMGLSKRPQKTRDSFSRMYKELTGPVIGLNNLYLHVTFACNLNCTHCYADASPKADVFYPVEALPTIAQEAAKLRFRHLVITGGEPLVHPQTERMLDLLASVRQEVKPLLTVLRTNLVMQLDDHLLQKIASSTDEVVVSVDGNQGTHDARRGLGNYQRTVSNLRRLVAIKGSASISIATVLPSPDLNGAPGQSVRALANELGIKRIRFRPLLPLGRAREMEINQEHIHGHIDPQNLIENGFSPAKSCGIGQNLYVQPDGRAFPCYAWHGEGLSLGSIDIDGLRKIIRSERFQDLGRHTVNSNEQCKVCTLRYLCGGACRAWNWKSGQSAGLDTKPENCTSLMKRAESLLQAAGEYLEVEVM